MAIKRFCDKCELQGVADRGLGNIKLLYRVVEKEGETERIKDKQVELELCKRCRDLILRYFKIKQ